MTSVLESGMMFGEFEDDKIFRIENSQLHNAMGQGIKTVEFILSQEKEKLLFVEAKTSCPNASNKDNSMEKKLKYEEYYSKMEFHFVLVIKNAGSEEWLGGPREELNWRLKRMRKIWKAKVIVLNPYLAEQWELLKK